MKTHVGTQYDAMIGEQVVQNTGVSLGPLAPKRGSIRSVSPSLSIVTNIMQSDFFGIIMWDIRNLTRAMRCL